MKTVARRLMIRQKMPIMLSLSALTGNHSALEFDGDNDFVSLRQEESLKPVEAITVEAWVKPYSLCC